MHQANQSVDNLLEQLRAGREELRREKAKLQGHFETREKRVRATEKKVRADERATALERKRVAAIYRRCLDRIRSRWAAERNSAEAERAQLEDSQDRFRQFSQNRRVEFDRLAERLGQDQTRLRLAWESLAEGQRRLITDRAEAEQTAARGRESLELRLKHAHEQHQLHLRDRQNFEGRGPALGEEIAALEQRATKLRQLVEQLQKQRDSIATEQLTASNSSANAIALASPKMDPSDARLADSLLTQLREREQELARERQHLAQAKQELDEQAIALADQRTILNQHAAEFASVRNQWQSAEFETFDELRDLVHGIRHGEQSLDERERIVGLAERRRRIEDHRLTELRFKLELWHRALAVREASLQTETEELDARIRHQREQSQRWEEALGSTAGAWVQTRDRESAFLRTELDRLVTERVELVEAKQAMELARLEFQSKLVEVAARDLASTGDKAGSTRLIQVLERRWRNHFRREERRLFRTETNLHALEMKLGERERTLAGEMARFQDRQVGEIAERTAYDLDRVRIGRELAEARAEAELEAQLRFRTEADARRLRDEIEAISQAILTANLTHPDEPDAMILPLQSAHAA